MVYGKVLSCVVKWKDVRLSDCGIVLIVSFKIKTFSETMNGPWSPSETRTESCNHRTRPNGKSEAG